MSRHDPLPPGKTPWDPVNGVRIGAIAGALVGGFVHLVLGITILAIIGLAVIGGAIGYAVERPRRR
ncbi:MAG: hypothetical protein OES57_12695 [Acidimicrobiia bacterium]|nr:hypothetical protein [Acidimicrobiia bacterium]